MPFRCKCGQTFEQVKSFVGHSSTCPRFNAPPVAVAPTSLGNSTSTGAPSMVNPLISTRKNSAGSMIITSGLTGYNGQPSPTLSTSPSSSGLYSSGSPISPNGSPNGSSPTGLNNDITSPGPRDFAPVLLPTGLSLQSTFAGIRRRSMSISSVQAQN